MCNAKDFSPFGYNNINNLSAGTESGLNGSTTPGFSDHTINIGCQSQVIKSNGQQIINKSCSDIIDCYANSSEKLATGECDPDNPLDSNCIYCCEDEYCNYDSHFESSFFLILKMANWRKNRLVLRKTGENFFFIFP